MPGEILHLMQVYKPHNAGVSRGSGAGGEDDGDVPRSPVTRQAPCPLRVWVDGLG